MNTFASLQASIEMSVLELSIEVMSIEKAKCELEFEKKITSFLE